ncbi:anti-sigma factor antagonist [Cellvibrio sp. KY-GH-1]|jgi:anti-anti-sigma factor|uniref:STAS domain-containing protein n=1 Tax=Cellvibrio sp. KY-GH-1 TaxID=2303332 RepID=UPI001246687A|nr:STAS domain-containing protein [Cellvibrio sp. KY-GH-1]QEY18669.1 anti-sigma factor antagonist [Cellvibrio sp. KY-GH-1]
MSSSAVIRMPKRFDYSSSTDFNGAISVALEQSGTITLDCIDLEYIDSAGIGLLVMSQKKAQSRQSKLVMINLKTAPKEILGLANLQKIIEIH